MLAVDRGGRGARGVRAPSRARGRGRSSSVEAVAALPRAGPARARDRPRGRAGAGDRPGARRGASAIAWRIVLGGSKRARYRTWLDVQAGRFDVVVGLARPCSRRCRGLGLIVVLARVPPGATGGSGALLPRARRRPGAGAHRPARRSCSPRWPVVRDRRPVAARRCAPRRATGCPVEVVAPGSEGRAPRLVRALGDRATRVPVLAAPRVRDRRGLPVRADSLPRVRRAAACCDRGGPGALRRLRGAGSLPLVRRAATSACVAAVANGWRSGRSAPHPCRCAARAGRCAAAAERRRDPRRRARRRARLRRGAGSTSWRSSTPTSPSAGPGLTARERAVTTWMEAIAWARPDGRADRAVARTPTDPAIQALVRGRPRPLPSRRDASGGPRPASRSGRRSSASPATTELRRARSRRSSRSRCWSRRSEGRRYACSRSTRRRCRRSGGRSARSPRARSSRASKPSRTCEPTMTEERQRDPAHPHAR